MSRKLFCGAKSPLRAGIMLHYVAICCIMLQYVAVCCNMLQYVAICCNSLKKYLKISRYFIRHHRTQEERIMLEMSTSNNPRRHVESRKCKTFLLKATEKMLFLVNGASKLL